MILWFLGPRPLGPMGPFIFWHFLKMCFMVWDLSRSVPGVFSSPGNPLIKLCRFIWNLKCNLFKVIFVIELPIELPIGIAYWPLSFRSESLGPIHCYIIIFLYYYIIIFLLFYYDVIILSYYYIIILYYYIIILLYSYIIILLYYYVIILLYYKTIISWYHHILIS